MNVIVKVKGANSLTRDCIFWGMFKGGSVNMKRFIIVSIAYLTTGIGFYHTFFGGSIVYGSLILTIGLLGILQDIFYKKLNAE